MWGRRKYNKSGAGGEIRTPTGLLPTDLESVAYTNFATPALKYPRRELNSYRERSPTGLKPVAYTFRHLGIFKMEGARFELANSVFRRRDLQSRAINHSTTLP